MSAQGRHRRSRSSHLPLWCTALVLGLLALGIYFRLHAAETDLDSAARSGTPFQPNSTAPVTPSPSPAIAGVAPKNKAATPREVSPPIHLTVPSIGVSTDLQPLRLAGDGSLQAPTKWQVAGWFADGIVPGEVGPAVIAGHIDSTGGPAVFYRLRELIVGATIFVTDQDGTVLSFVVDGVREYQKDQFPTKAVYGPTPTPELRLISCTGEFDHSSRSYLNNLVVSAHIV
jgi:hypothetical protein